MTTVKTVMTAALDLLFPPRCPFCDRPVWPFGEGACPECRKALHPLGGPTESLCCRCGKPLSDPGAEYCADCGRVRHDYLRGCAVYRYREVSGALYRMKYEGRAEYAGFLGARMAERFLAEFDPAGVDALVPVPVSADRMQRRGYNQAALLAKVIGAAARLPVREDILKRTRNTRPLRGMSAPERRLRLKNAFIVTSDDVKSNVYVLVDDIYTTGATVDACSRELLRAGAAGIFFITLAIGEDA